MKASIYRISLDVHDAHSSVCLDMKHKETARQIDIALTDGGFPYQISEECYAVFAATKADGKRLLHRCEIHDNIIRYISRAQTTAAVGLMECEIKLYGANDKLLFSPGFNILVSENAVTDDDDLISEDDVDELTHLISEAATVIAEGKAANAESRELINDMEDKRETLDQQIQETGSHAANAQRHAQLASQASQSASNSSSIAYNRAQDAQAAAGNAKNSEDNAKVSAQTAVNMANAALQSQKAAEAAAKRAEEAAANTGGGPDSGQNPPQDGEDGFSPIATVTQTATGATISITDKNGTTTATVTNGKDGKDGDHGVSPTVAVSAITGGHRIAITDKSGTKTVDVMDGEDGYTPQRGKDYWTSADVANIKGYIEDAILGGVW